MISDSRLVSFDSNALIYFLNGTHPYVAWLDPVMRSIESGERAAVLSVISEAELLVKPVREGDADVIRRIDSLFSQPNMELAPVTRDVARAAGIIRAQANVGLADALIAATAMDAGCDVLIGNDKKCAARLTGIPYVYLDDAVSR